MPAYTMRMKQLPKPEYQLMKMMVGYYGLNDPSELFTVLIRLGYEVTQLKDVLNGEHWLRQIIGQYRSDPQEQRTYELPSTAAHQPASQ